MVVAVARDLIEIPGIAAAMRQALLAAVTIGSQSREK